MGKVVNCQECTKVYRNLEDLEDLRDNDSICLACNALVEVTDWDRILASYEEDKDDIEEEEDEIEDDVAMDEDEWELDEEPDFGADLDDDEDPDEDEKDQ